MQVPVNYLAFRTQVEAIFVGFKKKAETVLDSCRLLWRLQRDLENSKLKLQYHYFNLTPKKNIIYPVVPKY